MFMKSDGERGGTVTFQSAKVGESQYAEAEAAAAFQALAGTHSSVRFNKNKNTRAEDGDVERKKDRRSAN